MNCCALPEHERGVGDGKVHWGNVAPWGIGGNASPVTESRGRPEPAPGEA